MMAEEVVNSFSRFRLREREEQGIELNRSDVKGLTEECERSLFGFVWGTKIVNFTGLKNTFSQL